MAVHLWKAPAPNSKFIVISNMSEQIWSTEHNKYRWIRNGTLIVKQRSIRYGLGRQMPISASAGTASLRGNTE